MRSVPNARRLSAILLRVFSLAVFSAGLGFAGYAGVQWLQTAHWQPLTVNGALAIWPTTRNWIAHPYSWLGLHRVVVWTLHVPVFVLVSILGAALLIVTDSLTQHPSTEHDFR
jgi:hypothetical protein